MNPAFYRPTRMPLVSEVARECAWETANRRHETARARKGRRVKSIGRVVELASAGRCVFVDGALGLRPAAWVASLQARYLHGLIERGVVYEYPPGKKAVKKAEAGE